MTSIWHVPVTVKILNNRAKNSLSEHIGIEFTELGDDFLAATMPVDERTKQPFGILHGGASCVLAETVASAAANFCIDNTQKVCVGLELNINHIKPVKSGVITGTARPVHLGKTTQVWEIKITQDTLLTALSRLTLLVLDCKI